jgi:hypothetical protein
LNVLLEGERYSKVTVGVRKQMRTLVPKFTPLPVPAERDGWNPVPAGPAPDDIYLCLEAERQSFWNSARPYVSISSEQALLVARRLRAAGARRLAVITPLEAILQLGMGSAIRNSDEMALVDAGFERIVILRPTAEEEASAPRGVGASAAGLVLRSLGSIMMPKRLQPVRVRHAAEIVVNSLSGLEDGVHIIGAARLHELAGDPLEDRPKR